jgi:hypothetical protein
MVGVVGNNSSTENQTTVPAPESSEFLSASMMTTLLGFLLAATRSRLAHQTGQNQSFD